MPEFRLTQISDTHLTRRHQKLTDNFHRVSEHIDATRPDLVINSGDLAFGCADQSGRSRICPRTARRPSGGLPLSCPAITISATIRPRLGPVPSQPATEQDRQAFRTAFGEDRWRFDAAGWCFIGLNSLIMNTGLASEAEQFDWLASTARQRRRQAGGAVPAQAAVSEFARRSRTRGNRDPLRAAAGAQRAWSRCSAPSICGWSPAATCTSAGILPSPRPARLGAVGRLHHSRPDAGGDRHQGSRAGGIPLPARQL